jgi:quercetin dioxygenase-like cupin family protein
MRILKLADFTNGWFVGNFGKGIVRTDAFEVACQEFRKGEKPTPHVHKIAKEVTVVNFGKFMANGATLSRGDVLVLEPGEPVRFKCLEDGMTTVVKIPSVPDDKYPIE